MFKRITLVAHRGYSSLAPENTMAAFELALVRGYKDIEFDVQLTKDGIPVIMHDTTIDRTTNGTGNINGYTYEELKSFDAGSWFDPSFKDQAIPSLFEVLTYLRGKAYIHIELKENQPTLPHTVAQLLAATGWLDDVADQSRRGARKQPKLIISSYDRDLLYSSLCILPAIVTHELLVEDVTHESLLWASEHGMRSYHPDGNDITPELIKKARKLNLHIGAWWWTREEQNVLKIKGARYAFVDSPHQHLLRHKVTSQFYKKITQA